MAKSGKKYAKYVKQVKPFRGGPGPMRNGLIVDALTFPLMTVHLEALTYHRTGSCYDPKKPFDMTREEYKKNPGVLYAFDLLPSHRSPMYHTYDEWFFFIGTNPDDPNDLGGELEFWLGAGEHAEMQVINKPSCIFVPAGMMHTPIDCTKLNRPFIELVVVPNSTHTEFHPGLWPTGYKPKFDQAGNKIPEAWNIKYPKKKKYGKYVHEVKGRPIGPMRNGLIVDAQTFPLMTYHLEALFYHHTGSLYDPERPFPLTMEQYKTQPGVRYAYDLLPSHRSPMYHTYDEWFFFVGTNPKDPSDLGGELEFWLGAGEHAEMQIINKPSIIYVPAGMMHCPIDCTKLNRPFYEFVIAPRPIHIEFHPGLWPPGYKPRFK